MSSNIFNTGRPQYPRGRGRGGTGARPMPRPPGAHLAGHPGGASAHGAGQQQPIEYNDFQLLSSARNGSMTSLMDFKTSKNIDLTQFARPVKLHRKEPGALYYERVYQNRQNNNNNNNNNNANANANAAGATGSNTASPSTQQQPGQAQGQQQGANADGKGGASGNPGQPGGNNNTYQRKPNAQPFTFQSRQDRNAPRTGADTSLIAPMGGAIKHKQMLFKKRTRQIYLSKDDTRELKEQEYRPWVLEDYDAQHSFTGTLEGGQRSDYVLFILTDNGFKVVSLDRWYKFQQRRNIHTYTADEAEEKMKMQAKLARHESTRWMMLDRLQDGSQEAESSGTSSSRGPSSRFRVSDSDKPRAKREDDDGDGRRDDSDIDDIDFDDVFQDDEEVGEDLEVEDEDVKDGRARIKKEIRGFGGADDDNDEEDDVGEGGGSKLAAKLTSEGKQLRKLVRDLEKNRAYESDEERDPYASSADDMETDVDEESEKEEEEEASTPKKKPLKRGPKKEALSKPIGRPGSPSLQQLKREPGGAVGKSSLSSSVSVRSGSSSPTASAPSTPSKVSRAQSPSSHPSSPLGAATEAKKRKMDDNDSTRPAKMANLQDDPSMITEAEVIDVLRSKPMSTKEFLLHFRKRIKKNEQNKTIMLSLLKKVARRTVTDDPNVKSLELKPEYA
ncbi:hypothetical protein BC940DRAFT_295684 [Gongronella butleri]|nr:hypothetical protein BC940DRAFT_295684 [Gongronella butleri]